MTGPGSPREPPHGLARLGIAGEQVFDASPNAYMVLDRELRFVAVNDAYLRATHATREALIGTALFDVFPNDPLDPTNASARLLRASFERVLATGAADTVALIPYRVTTDEPRFWSATHTPLRDAAGEVVGILQHTVDVTELHGPRASGATDERLQAGVIDRAARVQQANVLLDDERQQLRSLFEQAPGFTAFMRGPEHVFELANAAFYQVVGHRAVLGLPIRVALPEVEGQGFYELLDRVFETGEPFLGRGMRALLQRTPGGALDEVFLDQIYQPITDARGVVIGIFAQGQDITEAHHLRAEHDALLARERHARTEAERANQLKDEFLATVSHELRTPLTAMLGWVQMLRSGQLTTEDRRERALETIERNARAQAQLVEDLLDVGRIMSGKLQLHLETVTVGSVVEAAVESTRPQAAAKELVLTTSIDDAVHAMGDAGRIQQITTNLLSNAIKFSRRGGAIEVAVRAAGDLVEIEVKDDGEGIAAAFLPLVFEPFRQAEGGPSRVHGGLGLGLAIVKNLVELHSGSVAASSPGPDQGSSFVVTLPRTSARISQGRFAPASRPRKLEVAQELAGISLVVVDDEEDTRELLRALLERSGATVRTAGSASEAIALLESELPDVLLSDIGMPGDDGYSLIRHVRELPGPAGQVPAIALTAYVRPEDRARALRAGFRAHVSKPIDPRQLVTVVRSFVEPATIR